MAEIMEISPMLASSGIKDESIWNDNNGWIAQEKIDGSRYEMHFTTEGNRLTSRQISRKTGKHVEKTENCPHLNRIKIPALVGTVLDGEMQHTDFSQTVSIMGSLPETAILKQREHGFIDYKVFDILFYKGMDVQSEPLSERLIMLEEVLREIKRVFPVEGRHIFQPQISFTDKREFYEEIVKSGGEGVILKRLDGQYKQDDRSKLWLKVKRYITDDVVILGGTLPTVFYDGGSENWNYWIDLESTNNGVPVKYKKLPVDTYNISDTRDRGYMPVTKAFYNGWIGAIRFGKYQKSTGLLVELGQTSGIEDDVKSLVSDGNHGIKAEYIKTTMEIGAMEKIKKTGAYRHPRFLRLRPEKNANTCIE